MVSGGGAVVVHAAASSHHRSLVVGGHDVTDVSSYRGMVWSGVVDGEGWGCGGAMIHPDMFVTAAHCQPAFERQGGVFVGATKQDGSDGTYRKIRKTIPHPHHNHPDNDIMVVVLKKEKISNKKDKEDGGGSNDTIEYFEMNRNPDFPVVGTSITSIGFGLTKDPTAAAASASASEDSNGKDDDYNDDDEEDDVQLATILQEVQVDVWDFPSCQQTFETLQNVTLTESLVLCMGTVDGGRDACDSDSGSPLLAPVQQQQQQQQKAPKGTTGNHDQSPSSSPQLVLVGVINDGVGCGRPNTPAYNARISSYVQWIDYTICQWSDAESAPSYCLKYPYDDDSSGSGSGSSSDNHHLACNGGVNYDAFVGSVILAFISGMITTWLVGQHQNQRRRGQYHRILPNAHSHTNYNNTSSSNNIVELDGINYGKLQRGYSDEEMTAATAEPSPAFSTFSHKH